MTKMNLQLLFWILINVSTSNTFQKILLYLQNVPKIASPFPTGMDGSTNHVTNQSECDTASQCTVYSPDIKQK